MRRALKDVPLEIRAGAERLAPLVAGAVFGVVGFFIAPERASKGFFAAAAQIVPVLLLGLVLEADVFGGPVRRQPKSRGPFVFLGFVRRVLEVLTALVLVAAEWQAIHLLADGARGCNPWLAYGGITWGLVTVALLAALGKRPRVATSIEWRPEGARWIVELGMGNVYGDKDVQPVMNFLVPKGHDIYRCDFWGKLWLPGGEETRLLPTSEKIVADTIECLDDSIVWHYPSERVLLTAGDATVHYYSVEFQGEDSHRPPKRIPVVLRLDHSEVPKGRVELIACLDAKQPGRAASSG